MGWPKEDAGYGRPSKGVKKGDGWSFGSGKAVKSAINEGSKGVPPSLSGANTPPTKGKVKSSSEGPQWSSPKNPGSSPAPRD